MITIQSGTCRWQLNRCNFFVLHPLDFDLDYFACNDSILNHMTYELEITRDQFTKRDLFFLDNQDLRFSGLDFVFEERADRCFVRISHEKSEEESHLPTKREIEMEIDKTVNTLVLKKTRPLLITICRSCISGYCPGDYCEYIENGLKEKIALAYPVR